MKHSKVNRLWSILGLVLTSLLCFWVSFENFSDDGELALRGGHVMLWFGTGVLATTVHAYAFWNSTRYHDRIESILKSMGTKIVSWLPPSVQKNLEECRDKT